MTELKYNGVVRNDGTIFINKNKFKSEVGSLFKGQYIHITVRKQVDVRSLDANAYLWAVVYPELLTAFKEADPITCKFMRLNDIHQFCKNRFLNEVEVQFGNDELKELKIKRSTTSLNVSEFYAYIEQIRKFANEYFYHYIPEPDPNWRNRKCKNISIQKGKPK